MSTIISNNTLKKIIKYFLIIIALIIGLMLFTLIIQMIFNLGIHVGTFLRCLYSIVCS